MMPDRAASWTAMRIVDAGYWVLRGFAVGVNMPPVAMILIASAPCLTCARTAVATWSGVSASVPKNQQCPAVIVIGVPATSNLGPGMAPWWMAFLIGKATSLREPMSLIVVVPANTALRMAVTARIVNRCMSSFSARVSACASVVALQCIWQCASMIPGIRDTSPSCNTSDVSLASVGICDAGITSVILLPVTRTALCSSQAVISALAMRSAITYRADDELYVLCCFMRLSSL